MQTKYKGKWYDVKYELWYEEGKYMSNKNKQDIADITIKGSVSQISKLVGVSASMLRKYEDNGLISPIRNEDNQYRQYRSSDVSTLFQIRKLRSLNFSQDEIKKILNEDNPERNIESLRQYQERLQKRIQLEQLYNENIIHNIEMLSNKEEEIHYMELPPQIYQVFADNEDIVLDSKQIGETSNMINNMPAAFMAFLVSNPLDFSKGYQIAICWPDFLNEEINNSKYGHLSGGTYAYTAIHMNDDSLYTKLASIEKKVINEGYSICGDTILEFNFSSNFYTVYMPVK